MNEKKTPRIRFKGFTDDWEQRKVGELLSERIEQFPKSDEYPLMAFVANEGVAPKGDRYDRSALVNDTEGKLYKRTEFGDFIYSSNNLETGSIGLNKYGNATISPVYSIFRPTGIADSDFIGRRFIRKDFINEMVKWRQGVIYGQWKIHEEDFLKIEVMVPSLEEQRRIGSFLDNLDHLITLHQRKYEKLQIIKKSMLENCFPKNGEKVPKIRFSGFTGDWEQRKVSDLAERTYGGGTPTTSNEAYWNGDIPWIQSSDVVDGKLLGVEPRKWITQDGLNNSAAQLIPGNSIAIITRVGVGKLAFMPYSYATSQDFLSLSKLNAEPLFTVYALYKKLQSELNAVQGTSIKGITKDELLAKNIMVPQYAEQQQIGAFFKRLDNLITLHQSELEKLQKIKKSLLERMLV
jgi:type I restriction enzyme S subunit